MGYGDFIFWTPVIKKIFEEINNGNYDIKYIKDNELMYGITDIIKNEEDTKYKIVVYTEYKNNKPNLSNQAKEIFKNNPYICKEKYPNRVYLKIKSSDYYDLENRKFKDNKHVVEQYLINLNLDYLCFNNDYSGEIYFTDEEKEKVINLVPNKSFIFIQPINHKVARSYPFEKFQEIVDYFQDEIFIQDGPADKFAFQENKLLNNVLDYTGKFNFRETIFFMSFAKLCILNHGGLSNAVAAVKTQSIVIYPGYFDPKMTTYPTEINIYITSNDHKSCGWHEYSIHKSDKVDLCETCIKNYKEFDNNKIINIIKNFI